MSIAVRDDRYDRINTLILDYISITIKDSDVSSFYRYVISMKNLLRATEYTGKAGIFGITWGHYLCVHYNVHAWLLGGREVQV